MSTVEWTSLGKCQCWAADVDRDSKIRCLGVNEVFLVVTSRNQYVILTET